MSPWIAFLATLSLIILVHEWGHFIVARRIGVRVERFSFGFGPVLVRWRRKDTEYALSLLPFGGYVKLAGESSEDPRPAAAPRRLPASLRSAQAGVAAPPPAPAAAAGGGPALRDISGQKLQGSGTTAPGPAGSWEYRARSVAERATIVLAGPAINYGLGFLLFFAVFAVGAPVYTTRIGRVLEGFPAAEAGLRPGDRVVAVAGEAVQSWEEMTQAIQAQTRSVPLTVEREGRPFEQVIQPRVTERRSGLGGLRRIAMVGITPSDEVKVQRYPPAEALLKAGRQIGFLTGITLQALWRIATGDLSIRESITGPIGIFVITSSVAQQGVISLIQLIAVLSTSIGLFNLLPIPVLDGGHLAFLAAEWLRGRPVSLRAQEAMTRVGLGFLLLLLAVVTYNDLIRFDIGGRLMGLFGKG